MEQKTTTKPAPLKNKKRNWLPSLGGVGGGILLLLVAMTLQAQVTDNGQAEYQQARGALLDRSPARAAEWYKKAAEKGHVEAMFELGKAYNFALGVAKDETEAISWYKKAAENGHIRAISTIGLIYAQGRGVPQDQTEAFNWYKKAAEKGSVDNIYRVAYMYHEGKGTPQNYTEAMNWYRKAVQKGNTAAMVGIGRLYADGLGVDKNEAEALSWYNKAAGKGNGNAMVALGDMYASGKGVPEDRQQAIDWYTKAAHKSAPKAKAALAQMGITLPKKNTPTNTVNTMSDADYLLSVSPSAIRVNELIKQGNYNQALLFAMNVGKTSSTPSNQRTSKGLTYRQEKERSLALVAALTGIWNASSPANSHSLRLAQETIVKNTWLFTEAKRHAGSQHRSTLTSMETGFRNHITKMEQEAKKEAAHNRKLEQQRKAAAEQARRKNEIEAARAQGKQVIFY